MSKRYQVTLKGAASAAKRSTVASARLENRVTTARRSAVTGRYVKLNPARTGSTVGSLHSK